MLPALMALDSAEYVDMRLAAEVALEGVFNNSDTSVSNKSDLNDGIDVVLEMLEKLSDEVATLWKGRLPNFGPISVYESVSCPSDTNENPPWVFVVDFEVVACALFCSGAGLCSESPSDSSRLARWNQPASVVECDSCVAAVPARTSEVLQIMTRRNIMVFKRIFAAQQPLKQMRSVVLASSI